MHDVFFVTFIFCYIDLHYCFVTFTAFFFSYIHSGFFYTFFLLHSQPFFVTFIAFFFTFIFSYIHLHYFLLHSYRVLVTFIHCYSNFFCYIHLHYFLLLSYPFFFSYIHSFFFYFAFIAGFFFFFFILSILLSHILSGSHLLSVGAARAWAGRGSCWWRPRGQIPPVFIQY